MTKKQGVYQVQCPRCHVIIARGPDLSPGKRIEDRHCARCKKVLENELAAKEATKG